MAVFIPDEVTDQQLDWTILRDGGIALYWRPEVLANDLKWYESYGYTIVQFDAAEWNSEDQMHASLKSHRSFPDYYGRNLDALNDCLWSDLTVPDAGGLVLVLNHYDRFAKAIQIEDAGGRSFAQVVLHVFARAVRYQMLFGKRLLVLVQSGDPPIRFDNLAAISADWNPREWFDKDRRQEDNAQQL